MKKLLYLTLPAFIFSALPAKAVCPVCVVAIGAGLGLSEYLGIDDTVAGLWIGALLVAISAWTINWFNKKGWRFGQKGLRNILVFLIYYGLTFWPLFSRGFIGQAANRFLGLDKLIFGTIVGSIIFALAVAWYNYLKKKNNGQAHFPFQKVAIPLAVLLVFSFIFYWLTK